MFAAARYVRDFCRVDPIANHVADKIVFYLDHRTGFADCSIRQLADATMHATRTVVKAIDRLEEAGIIAVVRRPGRRGNRYRFPVVDAQLDALELSTNVLPRGAHSGSLGEARNVLPKRPNVLPRRTQIECEHLKTPEFSPLEPVPYLSREERERLLAAGKAEPGDDPREAPQTGTG